MPIGPKSNPRLQFDRFDISDETLTGIRQAHRRVQPVRVKVVGEKSARTVKLRSRRRSGSAFRRCDFNGSL
jgi:hypothetical protein